MVETLRLNRSVACPGCFVAVKPFVQGAPFEREVSGSYKPVRFVTVKCPREECGHQWDHSAASDHDIGSDND